MAKVRIREVVSIKGKPQTPGEVIEVEEGDVAELELHGWAERVSEDTPSRTPAKPRATEPPPGE